MSSDEDRSSVFLVRHGATEWSESGRHTGVTDLAMTAAGEDEARALSPLLASRSFAAVISSPMTRARRTADLAGLENVEIDPDLVEWNYGELEGRTTAEMRLDDSNWNVFDAVLVGGETLAQVGARVDRVIARCRTAGGDVALVGHGHCLRILAARWLGLEPGAGRLLHLASGTLSELAWEREQPVIKMWGTKSPARET